MPSRSSQKCRTKIEHGAGVAAAAEPLRESFPQSVNRRVFRTITNILLILFKIMTKHSKNNTASSIFSYAEYKKLDYGTKKVCRISIYRNIAVISYQQRLGNESMRRFDACALCLNRAREPLACYEGHLFCKECVYTDLRKVFAGVAALR